MEESSDSLVFDVNGERFELTEVDPSTTLLEFLRTRTRFKSPKLGCGEGGCGACVVVLSKFNHILKTIESFNVNTCLTLLCSINGCSVTTSEGLGNSKDGFHPIHKRFAGFHASQCGFCTPGMCMSLFSALVNAEKKNLPKPKPGFSKLTCSEAERAISGNMCRCTGYRPIADACKTFASDVDLEDLGLNCFWKKEDSKEEKISRLPPFNPKNDIYPYIEVSSDDIKLLNSGKLSWYTPATIEELQRFLHIDMMENGEKMKLVVGNTGDGYYKDTDKYDKFIDLRYIPELSVVKVENSGIEFGATISVAKVIEYLKENSKSDIFSSGSLVFIKIAEHMEKVASNFIRNSASLGGNLVMAQRKHFPSDIATLLLAAGSSLRILTGHEYEKITMDEFLSRPPIDFRTVLLSVHIPFLEGFLFETYRAAPRPLGNALSYVNAAFLADMSNNENGISVKSIRLAFGAFGTRHAIRARKAEEYLSGKILNVDVLLGTLKLVKDDVVPDEGTSYAAYRSSLAVSFVFDFLSNIPKSEIHLLSSAKQVIESSHEYYPVGEPLPKYGAALQAAGEAVYVDDIPTPPGCLHGAFIYSTMPLARVNGISFTPDIPSSVVTSIISAKDIPIGGENIGSIHMFGSEILFADNIARCAGDLLALAVAESQKKANLAVKRAHVDYDTKGLDPPLLTVEQAVEKSSFFDVPANVAPEEVGDFAKGMAEADHRILSAEINLGSEYYFYMETQTALAIPDEDNCIVVYCSIQSPEYVQIVIARCLGIPEHNVRVITRRVGGGFGGKALRSMHIATACALAAHKLRRPVRTYVDRNTDMIIVGGRHPMKITYSVGFKSDGKVTALHLNILINAGITADISPIMPNNIISALKKYNWGALSFDIKVCKTNLTSKSSMRAPGEVQGTYIAEAIIEHVASFLSMEPDFIRNKNLQTYETLKLFYGNASEESVDYTLRSLWDKLEKSSSIGKRMDMVEEFNRLNLWHKRGLSRVPIIHEVRVRPMSGKVSILSDGSIVVEVGGLELGQGLWTKVRQSTAYALSLIKCHGTENLVEKVRIVQTDTLSLVQPGFTAGSTTSESSCEAVRLCCNVLVERLTPLKEKLQEEIGSVNWDDLIIQAHDQNVHLAANTYFVPEPSSSTYLNYGVGVSEVEMNILTGETTILRTDIIYDCGQSVNPAVDLGQIEGCFVQGVGFFMLEEYLNNSDGLMVTNSTWTYHIPSEDNIPKQFNVEVLNSGHHKNRILSSKASGEPPLLIASSVHCAIRAAIKAARRQLSSWGATEGSEISFKLDVPAILPVVKKLCGLESVETYLKFMQSQSQPKSFIKEK